MFSETAGLLQMTPITLYVITLLGVLMIYSQKSGSSAENDCEEINIEVNLKNDNFQLHLLK